MKRITVAIALFLVAVAVSTVGILTIAGTEAVAAESSPTEIDDCKTISEPGRYVITQDITPSSPLEIGSGPCIQVEASDVVINGQGHTVLDRFATADAVHVGVEDRRLSNVTVKNIDVGNLDLYTAIRYRGVDGGSITNVTVEDSSGVSLIDSSNITVRESTFTGDGIMFAATTDFVSYGISVRNASDVVIAANTFREFTSTTINVGGGSTNTTVANNRLLGCAECFQLIDVYVDAYSYDFDLPTNPLPNEGIMIRQAIGATVTNNTIQHYGTGVIFDDRNSLDDTNATTRIANNTITANMIGVRINVTKRGVAIRHNDIVENDYGVYVPTIDNCIWDAAGLGNVGVHRNDIANNSEYGIFNERSFPLNATHNYWGAASGPSSAADSDAPFADPVTGTLADGAGDVISEDPGDPDVSNVHFDSSLNESVTNSSTKSVS